MANVCHFEKWKMAGFYPTKLFKAHLAESRWKSEISTIKEQQSKATHILYSANFGRTITDSVFAHESSTYPPSLTTRGKMHHGNKSEILDCIVPKELPRQRPVTTAAVLDGAVLIQMIRPRNSSTFGDYFKQQLVPYTVVFALAHARLAHVLR